LGSEQDSLVLCKIFQKRRTGLENEEVAVGDGETSERRHEPNFLYMSNMTEEHGMEANSVRDNEYTAVQTPLIPIEADPAADSVVDGFFDPYYDKIYRF
jgi:hypothetical protein